MTVKKSVMTVFLTIISAIGLFAVNGQTASAKAGYFSTASVPMGTYLKTKKTITTTNGYFNDVKVTIPKGTVFEINGLSTSNKTGGTYLNIDTDQLSWSIREPLIDSKHNQQDTAGIWAKTSTFEKVSAPSYLKYYYVANAYQKSAGNYLADGFLWQGTKWPTKEVGATADGFRVTTNGYLESYTNAPVFYTKVSKPKDYAKIQKATTKGKVTYLYYETKVDGVPATRLATSGKYQYRVAITRTGQHLLTTMYTDDSKTKTDSVEVSNKYTVAGTQYYMHTEVIF